MVPMLPKYKVDLEDWLSSYIGQRVQINDIEASIDGLDVVLHLRDSAILDNDFSLFQLKDLRVVVDLVNVVTHFSIEPKSIDLVGVEVSLERKKNGSFLIHGLSTLLDSGASVKNSGEKGDINDYLSHIGNISTTVRLVDSIVVFRDLQYEKIFRLTDIALVLSKDADGPTFSGAMQLPAEIGSKLRFFFKLSPGQKNLLIPALDFYIQGTKIRLGDLPWQQELGLKQKFEKGEIDLQVWGKLDNQEFKSIQSRVFGRSIELKTRKKNGDFHYLQLDEIQGDFAFSSSLYGWKIDIENFFLKNYGLDINSESLKIWSKQGEKSNINKYGISFDNLKLLNMAAVAKLFPKLPNKIKDIVVTKGIAGVFRRGDVILNIDNSMPDSQLDSLFVDILVDDFCYGKDENNLTINSLGARIQTTANKGVVSFDTNNGSVYFGKLFRDQIDLSKLTGDVVWSINDRDLVIESSLLTIKNADIESKSVFKYSTTLGEKNGFLDLQASFENGNARSVSKYLPTHIMHTNVISWLDNAFKGGRIRSGNVLVHGKMSEFPYENSRNGIFEVTADVEDILLHYDKSWPSFDGVYGKLLFRAAGMDIQASRGIVNSSINIQDISVRIPNFHGSTLFASGKVIGKHQGLKEFLIQTPLSFSKTDPFRQMIVSGDITGSVDLIIPLSKNSDHKLSVNTHVFYDKCALSFPKWNINLTDIHGESQIGENGVKEANLVANFYENPFKISIKPKDLSIGDITTIKTVGHIDVSNVIPDKYKPNIDMFSGESEWTIKINIPNSDDKGIKIIAQSDLIGTKISLPEPFRKSLDKELPLELGVDFINAEKINVSADFGGVVSTKLQFKGKEKLVFDRSETIFNGKKSAQIPKDKGIHAYGYLEKINLDDWRNLSKNIDLVGDTDEYDIEISDIRILVNHTTFLNKQFLNTTFQVFADDENWQIDVRNNLVDGELLIPINYQKNRLVNANFKRFEYNSPAVEFSLSDSTTPVSLSEDYKSTDDLDYEFPCHPSELPSLNLKVDQLVLNGEPFGELSFLSSPISSGLQVENLSVKGAFIDFTSNGSWLKGEKGEKTQLQASLKSKNIGRLLKGIGFEEEIRGGSGNASFDVSWEGEPSRVTLKSLHGNVDINAYNGQFPSIEPGAGRLVGLFSFNALARRLVLDFSDFFSEGFAFDNLSGSLKSTAGNAYINNLVIDGPQALIEITGRIGLVDKDYDQIMLVTPKTSSTIPVIAGLAAGTGVGVGVFLLQKIFSDPLDVITSSRYKVTGSWDNPVVEKSELEVKNPKYSVDDVLDGSLE